MIEESKIKSASVGYLEEMRKEVVEKKDAANRVLSSGKVGRTRVFARRDLRECRAEISRIDDEIEARKKKAAEPKPARRRKKRETLVEVEAIAPGEPEEG